MKIWNSYGSEHSMNLVLIGHFKEIRDAQEVEKLFTEVAEQVRAEDADSTTDITDGRQRFSDAMLALLEKHKIYSLAPTELEQFIYDTKLTREDKTITINTEEADVSAFIKLFIDNSAKVEVYSAHDYPDTVQGRGQSV